MVDYTAIATAQPGCAATAAAGVADSLQPVAVDYKGLSILCDVSTGVARPIIPEGHRRSVFAAVHGIGDPGVRATRRMLASRFTWRNLAKDVGDWCRDCSHCQRAKVTTQFKAPLAFFPTPGRF